LYIEGAVTAPPRRLLNPSGPSHHGRHTPSFREGTRNLAGISSPSRGNFDLELRFAALVGGACTLIHEPAHTDVHYDAQRQERK